VLSDIVANTLHRRDAMLEIRHLNEDLDQRVRERTRQLEAANSDLEAFSHSVSHDLHAPLRHVFFYASMVKDEIEPMLSEAGRHNLDAVLNAAKRMSELIQGLLEFSRLGRIATRMQRVNMNSLAADCIAALAPDTRDRRIVWSVGELPEVTADPLLLRQVLFNLLSNAVKYTSQREQARIEVAALPGRGDNGETVFMVRDNGIGFDMRYAHKLFGMFQRLHSSQEYEGHGVGLANVARIIQRHDGRIWAESAPNRGTAFYFFVSSRPAQANEEAGMAAASGAEGGATPRSAAG